MAAKTLYTNTDEPEHRIAVVVFTTVRAVDYGDGVGIVESAVRKVFRDAPGFYASDTPHAKTIMFAKETNAADWQVPVAIRSIRELSVAAVNGYITVAPSSVAYRGDER